MATFGLVHGAWHGAWAWDLLMPELRQRGHDVIAVDLPCTDRDAAFADYAQVVIRALSGAQNVVLVGHSMGGITIPLVASRREVDAMIFLCALVPHVAGDATAGEPPVHETDAFAALAHHDDGSHSWRRLEDAAPILYQGCSPELVASAFNRLRRQQTALWDGLVPLDGLPATRIASIVCTDDRTIRPEWSRWAARERLGVEAIELPGDHSPMLSQPAALADVLVRIADHP